MKLEETNHRHFKWKNVDYSKMKKEIIIRRHRIGEKLSVIGSGAADFELKTYAQLVEIIISRKRAKCIFFGELPVMAL